MKLCECIEKLTCLVTDHPELDDKEIVVIDEDGTETSINDIDFFEDDERMSYLLVNGKVGKLAENAGVVAN